jgi:hypothetical protein
MAKYLPKQGRTSSRPSARPTSTADRRAARVHSFLRRLRAGGRSNMYGAIPYLVHAFGVDRETAFRLVCDWVDAEEAAAAGAEVSSTA